MNKSVDVCLTEKDVNSYACKINITFNFSFIIRNGTKEHDWSARWHSSGEIECSQKTKIKKSSFFISVIISLISFLLDMSPQIFYWFSLDWLMQGNSIHQIIHLAKSGRSNRNEALSSWTSDLRTLIPRRQTVTHSAQPSMKHGSKSHSSVPRHPVFSGWHRVKLLYCAAIQRHRCVGEIKSLMRKRPMAACLPAN